MPLDLRFAFRSADDAGPYWRGAVDHAAPPSTPLEAEHAEWAAAPAREARP